jgi:hypothetical protein
MPVTANVKFIEDNVQKKLGDGLWQTASKLRTFRPDVLDVKQNTAVSLVVLEEGMNLEPTSPRAEAIGVATKYPEGLKIGSFVKADAQFAPDAYRFENGRLMAGPGCTFFPGCDNQRFPTLSGIKYREPIVDEELGIVLLRMNFGPGSVSGPDPVLVPWEIFKVSGQIQAVEAFMKMFPASMGTGWE